MIWFCLRDTRLHVFNNKMRTSYFHWFSEEEESLSPAPLSLCVRLSRPSLNLQQQQLNQRRTWMVPGDEMRAPHRSSSLLIAPHRSSSLLIAPHRSSSLFIAPHRSSSLLIAPHRSSSLFIAPHRSSSLCSFSRL